jgi:hypothetical protein
MSFRRRVATVVSVLLGLCSTVFVLGALPAQAHTLAHTYRSCEPVRNPYAGSRYEGADLSRIRALGVSCLTARRVAKGAHRKALGLSVPSSGIRTFRWRRWNVTGDLRGPEDRYLAKKAGGGRVRWRF